MINNAQQEAPAGPSLALGRLSLYVRSQHMMKLSDMGFDQWFEAHAGDLRQESRNIARISAVDRGSYLIRNQIKEVPAELAGKEHGFGQS